MALKVFLCDASKDENGKDGYEGSKPGNQFKLTGDPIYADKDEVRTVTYLEVKDFWWKDRSTRVFRLKRKDMAKAFAIRMKQTSDNPNVGYSQPGRKLFYEAVKNDPDPSHVKTLVECDCSSDVNTNLWNTFKTTKHPETKKVYPLARTVDMPGMFAIIDEIEDVTDKIDLSTGNGFEVGDILVIPNCHTAAVWDIKDEPDPVEQPYKKGIVKTDLYIRTGPGTKYDKCYIQMAPDYIVRNTLRKGEEIKIIDESNGWYQIKCKGDVYTWTPWCYSGYVRLAN